MSAEFVDTNILVYSHDLSAGFKRERSRELLTRLFDESTGALSMQVLTEFYSVVSKRLGMSSDRAEEVLSALSLWQIHRPEFADLMRAIELQRRYRISWWDALIVNSALQMGAGILWSEDLGDGQRYGSLVVRNPFL